MGHLTGNTLQRPTTGRIHGWLEQNFHPLLILAPLFAQLTGFIVRFGGRGMTINRDSAVFQHAGWYITQGAVPYVSFWDVKPPLIYYLTAAISTVTGGDMLLLHLASSTVGAVAIAGTMILTGLIIFDITNNAISGLVSANSLLLLPPLYTYSFLGIRPKYLTMFFALLSFYLVLNGRYFGGGVSVGIATGFYPTALLCAGIAAGLSYQTSGRRALAQIGGGILSVGVFIVTPFVFWGAVEPLFAETVFALFITTTSASIVDRVLNALYWLGPGALILLAGIPAPVSWRTDSSPTWWILAGILAYGAKVLLVDMEGWPDIILLVMFLALGVGLLIAEQPTTMQLVIAGVAGILVVANLAWMLMVPIEIVTQDHSKSVEVVGETKSQLGIPRMNEIYWGKITPKSCHYRLSGREHQWIRQTSASYSDTHCGRVAMI